MRVALYARVSTTDKGQDPDTQLIPLREWAERMGYTIVEYVGQASTANLRARAQWRQLLDDARKNVYDMVVVLKIERAWRSVHQMHVDLEYLDRHGKQFMAISQVIHTQGAIGKLVLNFLAGVAEFERELIRERTREGMQRVMSQGVKVGRPQVTHLVDVDLVARLRSEGASWSEVHRQHPRTVLTTRGGYRRPGITSIRRALAKME